MTEIMNSRNNSIPMKRPFDQGKCGRLTRRDEGRLEPGRHTGKALAGKSKSWSRNLQKNSANGKYD